MLDPRLLQLDRVLYVLVVAQQGLLGEVVTPFLYGEHGALLPVFGEFLLLLGLRREPLLIGDRGGHLLLGFRQLAPHVDDQLLENLFRILGPRDQVRDVGPDQRGQTVKDSHSAPLGLLAGLLARPQCALALLREQPLRKI